MLKSGVSEELKEIYNFSICFPGNNEIPLQLLSVALRSIDELTNMTLTDEIRNTFIIKAVEPGSFILHLTSETTSIKSMICQKSNIAESSLKLINRWVEIKKFLDGEPPSRIERNGSKFFVYNKKGESIETNKDGIRIVDEEEVNNKISKLANSLFIHNKGLDICTSKNDKILTIENNQTAILQKHIKPCDVFLKVSNIKKATVYVKTAHFFNSPKKWELFYMHKTIQAKIEDTEWLKDFRDCKNLIGEGTEMEVNLKEEYKKDIDGNPILNTINYTIMKINTVKYGSTINEQLKL